MGLCAVADLVIAEMRDPLRVHRDAPRDPAGGHQPVRRREDRRESRPGPVPGRPAVRRDPGAADRARPRGRRGRGGARRGGRRGGRRPAGGRTDGRPGGQGDRPRGPRAGPRLVEVAHRAGHRPAAHERRGPGGLPRVRREAPAGLGARPGLTVPARRRRRPICSTSMRIDSMSVADTEFLWIERRPSMRTADLMLQLHTNTRTSRLADTTRPICDNRDTDARRTESEPGRGADRDDDTVRPALDRERSAAGAARRRTLACRV